MTNALIAWITIVGLVVGPFLVGMLVEQKLQWSTREYGSRLLRRY